MALLTPQGGESASVTYSAATAGAGGDTYANSGKERVHVRNASGGSINVTFVATGTCDQGVLHDKVVAVPAGQDRLLPAVAPARFGNPTKITYSAVASVTVAAV